MISWWDTEGSTLREESGRDGVVVSGLFPGGAFPEEFAIPLDALCVLFHVLLVGSGLSISYRTGLFSIGRHGSPLLFSVPELLELQKTMGLWLVCRQRWTAPGGDAWPHMEARFPPPRPPYPVVLRAESSRARCFSRFFLRRLRRSISRVRSCFLCLAMMIPFSSATSPDVPSARPRLPPMDKKRALNRARGQTRLATEFDDNLFTYREKVHRSQTENGSRGRRPIRVPDFGTLACIRIDLC